MLGGLLLRDCDWPFAHVDITEIFRSFDPNTGYSAQFGLPESIATGIFHFGDDFG